MDYGTQMALSKTELRQVLGGASLVSERLLSSLSQRSAYINYLFKPLKSKSIPADLKTLINEIAANISGAETKARYVYNRSALFFY